MTITLQTDVNRELLPTEADENIRDLAERTAFGWKDLVSTLHVHGVPIEFQPTYKSFGPSGLRMEPAFEVGDYMFAHPFHVNHDVVRDTGRSLIHVHWATSGTSTESVRWEFQILKAKGHDQEFYGAAISYFVEAQPNQTALGAWRHYVTEIDIGQALVGLEPDTNVLVTLRRVTNGAVDNADDVSAQTVDFHYEADRDTTPNRAPAFYA